MKKLVSAAAVSVAAMATLSAARPSQQTEVSRGLNVFNQLFKELATFYVDTIDARRSIELAITAMLDDIDPYTEYISDDNREAFTQTMTGEYGGIGSYIMTRNGDTYISMPNVGSPAWEAGLRPGDRIVTIDGDTVLGKKTPAVSERLRGQAGTPVSVTVWRPYVGADSVLTFNLIRRKIQTPSVGWHGMLGDTGIGYISLEGFLEHTPEEVQQALLDLKSNPALKGLVIDLRGNGGGLVESAVQVLGYVLPKGTEVLRTRGRDLKNERIYKTYSKPIDTNIPLAVLIDKGSASASEIVAGAVQDLDRGVILGERSFGKGLVQTTRQLPYDNMLKVTTAKYYIPSGRLVQAIDYSRRNSDGSVQRIPDSLTHEFTTSRGRKVRDGGGITPDLTINEPGGSRLVYELVVKQYLFDYANRYRATHDSLPVEPEDLVLDDEMWAEFKSTINPETFQYDRVWEQFLNQLLDAIKVEGFDTPEVRTQVQTLDSLLRHDLDHDLNLNRDQIGRYLLPEIAERYYLTPGRIRTSVSHGDSVLTRAIEVLSSPDEYKRLLSPQKSK